MVEGGFFPIGCVMTGGAILPEFSVVLIVFLMAGEAIAGRALENIVDMAIAAFRFGVFAFQLESGQVVVKSGRLPGSGFVASAAIFPKLAFVGIVFLVACAAVSGRRLEISSGLRVQVAFVARRAHMFAFQLESDSAVIEIFPDGFDAIVAAPAICSVSLAVGGHENLIDLLVTGGAGRRVKPGNIIAMTI